MLRRHAELAGLKSNFTILDTDDQLRLMKQLIAGRGYRRETLARPHPGQPDRRLEESRPAPRRSQRGRGPRAMLSARARTLYRQYQERLKALNAVGLRRPAAGDAAHPEKPTRHPWPITADRIRYMLVDEYQDTNVVQYLWLNLLAKVRAMSVWWATTTSRSMAGAAPRSRTSCASSATFPAPASSGWNGNYRSTPVILGAASGLIAANKGRLGKTLWTEGGCRREDQGGGRVGRGRRSPQRRQRRRRPAPPGPQFRADGGLGAGLVPDARFEDRFISLGPALSRHRRPAFL